MEIMETSIKEVKIIMPKTFEDERGIFYESFNQKVFSNLIGQKITFVQDNHSRSKKGVLRGMHYQLPPLAQAKLVRVVQGKIFDVAVDIRQSSSTFGQWVGEILSAKNKRQLWIPEGFAHGFLTLSSSAEVLYKTTNYYFRESERSIRWNDPSIGIDWMNEIPPLISLKDNNAQTLTAAEVFL